MSRQSSVLAADDLHCQHVYIRSVERGLQGTHLVEEDSQGPQVTLEAVWLVVYDFGTQVVRRAHDGHGLLHGIAEYLGNAKVTQFDDSILCQEYIT